MLRQEYWEPRASTELTGMVPFQGTFVAYNVGRLHEGIVVPTVDLAPKSLGMASNHGRIEGHVKGTEKRKPQVEYGKKGSKVGECKVPKVRIDPQREHQSIELHCHCEK